MIKFKIQNKISKLLKSFKVKLYIGFGILMTVIIILGSLIWYTSKTSVSDMKRVKDNISQINNTMDIGIIKIEETKSIKDLEKEIENISTKLGKAADQGDIINNKVDLMISGSLEISKKLNNISDRLEEIISKSKHFDAYNQKPLVSLKRDIDALSDKSRSLAEDVKINIEENIHRFVEDLYSAADDTEFLAEDGKLANLAITNFTNIIKELDPEVSKSVRDISKISYKTQRTNHVSIIIVLIGIIVGLISILLIPKYLYKLFNDLVSFARKISEGDLTQEGFVKQHVGILGVLQDSLNAINRNFQRIISKAVNTAFQLSSTSQELSKSAGKMAGGAKEQTLQTEQVAAAMEQISSIITQTAEDAKQVSEFANEAVDVAVIGREKVTHTIGGMYRIAGAFEQSSRTVEALGKSSNQISKITTVIDNIAHRIDLLAINASIQAVSAGEHGKSFSVVAHEIRKLSEVTTDSLKEIASIIQTIQKDINRAIESMKVGNRDRKSVV